MHVHRDEFTNSFNFYKKTSGHTRRSPSRPGLNTPMTTDFFDNVKFFLPVCSFFFSILIMLFAPNGPAQAQYWIDQERTRRRIERLKQSKKCTGLREKRLKLAEKIIIEISEETKVILNLENL